MKDQELHDIFHAYRPEMGGEEDFMARLNEQMDTIDAKQQPRIIPFYRRVLPWAAGIAAVIAVAFLFDKGRQEPQTEAYIQTQLPEYYYNRYSASSDSYEEIVNEIERSGRQLENAIAQL
jgi:hypothetical protein